MKKAFTLIELLAVIVILAVIALIATPLVLDVIDDSKYGAYSVSALAVTDQVDDYLLAEEIALPSNLGDTIEISVDDLITSGYIKNFDSGTSCTGYVGVTLVGEQEYQYSPEFTCSMSAASSSDLSLLGHWEFNNNVYDATINNNHGIDSGLHVFIEDRNGEENEAIRFSDSTDLVELTSPVDLSGDFTVAYWMLTSRATNWRVINNETSYNNAFGYRDTDTISFWDSSLDLDLSDSYMVDKWFNDVIVKEGNVISVYRDGSLIGSGQWNGTASLNTTQFGSTPSNSSWSDFQGGLDDVRIFGRALSSAEVRYLYADME